MAIGDPLNTMNLEEASKTLEKLLQSPTPDLNVLLVSKPGMGKSEMVMQTAARIHFDCIIKYPALDESVEYKGHPFAQDGTAKHLPYEDLCAILNATKPTVMFLDEIGQAMPSVQNAIGQLIQSRMVGGKRIPDHVRFVAATNRREDKAGVQGMVEQLKSRFAGIWNISEDVDGWCKWAVDSSINMDVIYFIRFKREMLMNFTPSKAIENYACPRTVVKASKILDAGIVSLPVFAGCCGDEWASAFMSFLEVKKEVPDIAQVERAPDQAKLPKTVAGIYSTCAMLAKNAKHSNLSSINQYFQRLEHKEFVQMFWTDAVRKDVSLAETREFISWTSIDKA